MTESQLRAILIDVFWTGYYIRQNRTFINDADATNEFVPKYLETKLQQQKGLGLTSK